MSEVDDKLEAAEARLTALASILRGTLTTLVLRGLLNKPAVDEMLKETADIMRAHGAHQAAFDELTALSGDLPEYLREAMGPGPDPDFEDH